MLHLFFKVVPLHTGWRRTLLISREVPQMAHLRIERDTALLSLIRCRVRCPCSQLPWLMDPMFLGMWR